MRNFITFISFCFFSISSRAHNYNVAELKQALAKSYSSLGSDVESPSKISSQVKEVFGSMKGELFEVRFKENFQKENAGWVFLFEQEETPHLVSFSRVEKKIKAFLIGKNLVSESDFKDYPFLKKINDEMLSRLTPQALREHDHSSLHGGMVLMFIDDHVEISRSSQNQIFAYVSDKKRQGLALDLFEKINFTLFSKKKSISLKSEKMKHGTMEMLMVSLPDKVLEDAVLSILLKRKKGNSVTRVTRLSLIPFVDVKDAMKEHSVHEGDHK